MCYIGELLPLEWIYDRDPASEPQQGLQEAVILHTALAETRLSAHVPELDRTLSFSSRP